MNYDLRIYSDCDPGTLHRNLNAEASGLTPGATSIHILSNFLFRCRSDPLDGDLSVIGDSCVGDAMVGDPLAADWVAEEERDGAIGLFKVLRATTAGRSLTVSTTFSTAGLRIKVDLLKIFDFCSELKD